MKSEQNLTMENQINPLLVLQELSLSVQNLQLHASVLSCLLKEYTPYDINKQFPIVFQKFLEQHLFDTEAVKQINGRFKTYHLHFQSKFQKALKNIQKLKSDINQFKKIHQKQKIDRENGIMIYCSFNGCDQSFNTKHGLDRHILRKHKTVEFDDSNKEEIKKEQQSPKKKCIRKRRRLINK